PTRIGGIVQYRDHVGGAPVASHLLWVLRETDVCDPAGLEFVLHGGEGTARSVHRPYGARGEQTAAEEIIIPVLPLPHATAVEKGGPSHSDHRCRAGEAEPQRVLGVGPCAAGRKKRMHEVPVHVAELAVGVTWRFSHVHQTWLAV